MMEKPLGRYFQVLSPYYQVAQCNQETPIPGKHYFKKCLLFLKKFLDITIQFSQYINAQRCSFIKTTSKPIWKLYVNIFLPEKWL